MEDNNTVPEQQDKPAANTGGDTKPAGTDNAKTFGILGYILPVLFFLPLVTDMKENDFAMFHANQQLNLLLYWVAMNVLVTTLAFIIIGFLLAPLLWLFGIVLAILGITNVINGNKKPLPLIGGIKLIN